jgi:hypothetical protein
MQLAGGGAAFLDAAQQGMFAIDTDAATQMMTSIKQIQTSLDEQRRRIRHLEEQVIAELDTQPRSTDEIVAGSVS